MNVLRMTRKRGKIIGEKLSDVLINGSLEIYKMCHDIAILSVLNLNLCFVYLQMFSGFCDQFSNDLFVMNFLFEKKKYPVAGSMSL